MAKSASPSYERPSENVARKQVLPPSKARAGLKDKDTLYMLVVGVVLTILFFGAIYFTYLRA
jgi:hypothetical protein